MKLGSFNIFEPVPELKEAHALAMLRPWIDVGDVGTLTLERLESTFGATQMGSLAKPGNFFDFTRYRPAMYLKEGIRQVALPNSTVTFARRETHNDFMFLHLLEPHMLGEVYISSVLQLLKRMGVRRYCLIGSMYDLVPHTRPLLVSGGATGKRAAQVLEKAGVRHSHYEGPTTICYLISQEAQKAGIETVSLIVHIPQYTEYEDNYMGQVALLKVLGSLYGFSVNDSDTRRAESQLKETDTAVRADRKLKAIVAQLEANYDARMTDSKRRDIPGLSPEVEQFLKEMENRFKQE